MSGFGRSGNSEYTGPTESKDGCVTNITTSPERGKKRIMVREKRGSRKAFSVDMPLKETKKIKRKIDYSFDVYENEESERGGMMKSRVSSSKMRQYLCDEAPELYTGKRKPQFKSFSSK